MSKKMIILLIFTLVLFVFWQIGGLDFLLDQTTKTLEDDTSLIEDDLVVEEIFLSKNLDYEVEIIGQGLEIPWEIVVLLDGRILVTERPGRVVMLDKGEIHTIHNVEHIGEGGLLGMVISPDFESNNQVFLYYTYRVEDQIFNRVSRFTLEGYTLTDEVNILDNIPGAKFHNGGRIKFGPDGKLYISTGDSQEPNLSQDIDSLAGKILRINPDGTVPEDNPFDNNLVYAYGLRNPQGLSWHPVSNELYASDHGPDKQDEINLILPGKNYGWPIVSCSEGGTEYEDPITCYSGFTLAPSGIDFLPWSNLEEVPLYVAGLRGNMIMRIDLDDDGNYIKQEELFNDYGRIRTIVYHDGALYIATNNRDGRGVSKENDDLILKVTPVRQSIK